MRVRLDLRPENLCERSAWTSAFVQRTIEVVPGRRVEIPDLENCELQVWRDEPWRCPYLDEEVTDHWDVQYVSRDIDVPAGHFDDCLCVRRRSSSRGADKTYCFADGIGKVYELDRGNHVECLESYRIDDDTTGPPVGWHYSECREDMVEF